MGDKKAIFVVRTGPPEDEANWNKWLNNRHIPDRLALPGFLFAQRFVTLDGDIKYLNLYGLSGAAVMNSDGYTRLRDREATQPADTFEAQSARLPRVVRQVYEPIYPENTDDYLLTNAKLMMAVGIDVPLEHEEELNAWYNTEHMPLILRVPGFLVGQRFMATQVPLSSKSGRPVSGPKYIALYSIANQDVLCSEDFNKVRVTPWTVRVSSLYKRAFRCVYACL